MIQRTALRIAAPLAAATAAVRYGSRKLEQACLWVFRIKYLHLLIHERTIQMQIDVMISHSIQRSASQGFAPAGQRTRRSDFVFKIKCNNFSHTLIQHILFLQ